jgi:pimeloyl-ACP methyl ester carboxylesterase
VKVVLIPGWNEAANKLRVLADGRRGHPGFVRYGFDCALFDKGHGSLRERIDQFAEFLAGLKTREPEAFPVATFGYSAGGLINRGFLRAYPERAGDVAATFQLGAPNWGIVTDNVALILNALHISQSVIADLDIESEFMAWLNDAPGHWESIPGSQHKRWKLDRAPWVAPERHPILNVLGRVPKYSIEGDGLVDVRSGTLDGDLPHAFIGHEHANHLNLSGMWNIVTFLIRRWPCDDRVWPQVVETAATHFRVAGDRREAAV